MTTDIPRGSGEFVYYHVEDREGANKYRNGEPLTIADLRDDVPLFLCENPKEWFPDYLPSEKRSEFTVYEVRFSVPSYIVFNDDTKKDHFSNPYFDMFYVREVDGKRTIALTDKFKKIHEGSTVDLFCMKTERELSECFLVNSSKRVTSITPIKVRRFK